MIDTHCHLTYAPLYEHLDAVLERAGAAGVRHMITIGTRHEDCVRCVELAQRYPQVSSAVGIHPHHAAETSDEELEQVIAMLGQARVVAAGEMGLDYHYDFSPKPRQQRVFERQLAASKAAALPVVLHSRESVDDCLAILKSAGVDNGVFHCFTGTPEETRRILNAGFHVGFTGIITFKNTQIVRDSLAVVPLDRLLLETDAPYLSPEPMRRHKNNEPALIAHTFARAAEIRRMALEELIQITSANATRLFGLDRL